METPEQALILPGLCTCSTRFWNFFTAFNVSSNVNTMVAPHQSAMTKLLEFYILRSD